MGVALVTAQDLLTPYFENGKVIMPSQNVSHKLPPPTA
jgi:hypothetical protein